MDYPHINTAEGGCIGIRGGMGQERRKNRMEPAVLVSQPPWLSLEVQRTEQWQRSRVGPHNMVRRAAKEGHLRIQLSPNCGGDHTIREPGCSSKDAFSASQPQHSSTSSHRETGSSVVSSQNTCPYPNLPHHPATVVVPHDPSDQDTGGTPTTHNRHQQFQGQAALHR